MSISAITNIAVSGMQAAAAQLATAADNTANLDSTGYQRRITQASELASGGVETRTTTADGGVNLDHEMLNMIGAKLSFEANASVFETGADLWQVLSTIKRD